VGRELKIKFKKEIKIRMYVRLEKGGAPREGVPQTAIRYKIYDP
jgi:hypothetical protein